MSKNRQLLDYLVCVDKAQRVLFCTLSWFCYRLLKFEKSDRSIN